MQTTPEPQTILEVLAAQKARHGGAPAILAPDADPLSYAALHDEIERVGTMLASMGLGRGSRVAISLPSEPASAVTMLATMIWATAAPLSPGLGFDDYSHLLARLGINGVIVPYGDDSPLAHAVGAAGLRLGRLRPSDAFGGVALSCDATGAAVTCVPSDRDDIAVLMQTSGTTSRPKIVPITQAQLVWNARQAPIDEHDRYLSIGSIFNSTGLMNGLLSP